MTETEIKKDILARYKQAFPGGKLVRVFSGRAHGGGHIAGAEAGTPDLCGYLPDGRFLGVEIKKPGAGKQKKHDERQDAFQTHANDAGGVCVKVSSWHELREIVMDALKLPFE